MAFSTNFCPIKNDLSGNTVWLQISVFQKLAKLTTQNVNVARFAHNVEWDFFCVIFKHRGLQSFVREKCLDGVYQVYAESSLEIHLVV